MKKIILPSNMSAYVSLDLETTGLKPQTCQVLEIGAVVDLDGVTDPKDLPTFRALIKHEKIVGEEYALNLNKLLIEEAMDSGITVDEAVSGLIAFLEKVPRNDPTDPKIHFCGKNLSMFDLPFLRTIMNIDKFVKHRVMDVGSLYYPYFGKVPSLADVNELIYDNGKVAHTAVEDSINCINLFRFEFEFKKALLNHAIYGTPVPGKFVKLMSKFQLP